MNMPETLKPLVLQQPETLPGWRNLDHRTREALKTTYWAARRGNASAFCDHMEIRVGALETEWVHEDGKDGPLVSRVSPRGRITLARYGKK